MKGFDINQIKIKSEDKNIERTLTGEVTRGIQPGSPITPNSEVEKNEYIKYPDQSIQKVEGKTHEQGGVKMKLPDATEVISDTLKLKAKDVKSLEKDFGMDLSTKDTFARAIEKYTRKIGLTKINDEQEDIFKQLKKELAKTNIDDKTKKINNDYLSKKIYDLEAKKVPLEEKRKAFFDATFKMQEDNKPKTEDQNFKYGGVSSEAFAKLSKEMGLTVEEAQNLINGIPNTTFELGGTYAELTKQIANKEATQKEVRKHIMQLRESGALSQEDWEKLDGQSDKTYISTPATIGSTEPWNGLTGEALTKEKTLWKDNEVAFKDYAAAEKKIKDPKFKEDLFKNFTEVIKDDAAYKSKNKDTYKAGLNKMNADQVVEQLLAQEKRNALLAVYGMSDKADQQTMSGQNINKTAYDLINANKSVLGDLDFSEGYKGQAAYIAYQKTVGADKSKDYKANQFGQADETVMGVQGRVSPIDNASTDTTLFERVGVKAEPTPIDPVTKKPIITKEGTPIVDNVNTYVKPKYPQMFYTPDQSVMPPSAQTPETLIRNRFQRIDPIKIGTVNADQEVDKTAQFSISQLDGLTPSQRAATIASLLTTTGALKNQSALSANITNAQNMANAEQFNIGQSDRENIAEGQNRLNFEARTLTGQAKTEQSLRNYLEYQHNVSINNFQNSQKLNMINSLFPDYQLDFYGNSVNYDPSTEWKLQNNDIKNSFLQQPITTTDAQTLKKE